MEQSGRSAVSHWTDRRPRHQRPLDGIQHFNERNGVRPTLAVGPTTPVGYIDPCGSAAAHGPHHRRGEQSTRVVEAGEVIVHGRRVAVRGAGRRASGHLAGTRIPCAGPRCTPPSSSSNSPVTVRAPSINHSTASATSSGVQARPSGALPSYIVLTFS